MHKAKVNTKNSDMTSSGSKKLSGGGEGGDGQLPPVGEQHSLDERYNPFYDCTIAAADRSKIGPAPLMRQLNRVHEMVAGLGVVLRIVAKNASLANDPDLGGPPPLCPASEYLLTAMAAAICEELSSDIQNRADFYNDEVEA
jgi:hypothetical protein